MVQLQVKSIIKGKHFLDNKTQNFPSSHLIKPPPTNITQKRLLPSMRDLMLVQTLLSTETLPTHITPERSCIRMHHHVHPHVPLLFKRFPTNGTLERFFPRVDPHVNRQMTPAIEPLTTVGASVRFLTYKYSYRVWWCWKIVINLCVSLYGVLGLLCR